VEGFLVPPRPSGLHAGHTETYLHAESLSDASLDLQSGVASMISTDSQRFAEAQRRVAAIRGFYTHLLAYVVVLALLFVLNAATGGEWWVQWVFFGWGIGVLAHALATFARTPEFVQRWEKRKLRQMLGR
jgi:hypothetical protein